MKVTRAGNISKEFAESLMKMANMDQPIEQPMPPQQMDQPVAQPQAGQPIEIKYKDYTIRTGEEWGFDILNPDYDYTETTESIEAAKGWVDAEIASIPAEAGVPFVKPQEEAWENLQKWNGELELPFDNENNKWGRLLPSKVPSLFDDVTVYHDPQYEPYEAGGRDHPETLGGYWTNVKHVVIDKRDVIGSLSPKYIEAIEDHISDELNENAKADAFTPPDDDDWR